MRRSACSTGSAATTPGTAVPERLVLAGLALIAATHVAATAPSSLGAFSRMSPETGFDDGWMVSGLRDVSPTRFDLVDDDGRTVLRAHAEGAAASLTRAVSWDPEARPLLAWRWRVDRVVTRADISSKQGDDFAARLYVFFDYPLSRLSFTERTKVRLARWWYGGQVPTAAICYVWANRETPGTSTWNAYTSRVRMVVLRNADSAVGDWVDEQRDLAADFLSAFGEPAPRITGLALAADTDQTGETVTAWFGDIHHAD